MIETTPHLKPKPIGAGPSGRGLHGLGPPPKPGASGSFGVLLLIIAAVPFAIGLWSTGHGLMTLTWPRADGLIVYRTMHRSQPDEKTRRMSASVDLAFRYTVDGKTYSGSAIAPKTFGWQNSTEAEKQYDRYITGSPVRVAYDPSNPEIAYLEPGPSSFSLMLIGAGLFIGLPGSLIKRLATLEKRAAARREPT
jgi:Protein of unknown function (DUF3592)